MQNWGRRPAFFIFNFTVHLAAIRLFIVGEAHAACA
jgi:hypothetical protein